MATNGNHSRRGSSGGALGIKIALVACVLLVMAAASSPLFSRISSPSAESGPPAQDTPPASSVDNLVPSSSAPESAPPESAAPESAQPSTPLVPRPAEDTAAGVGLGIAVPESAAVADSYFDDAVFVGNSRTEALKMYSGIPASQFYCNVGLAVDTAFTQRIVNLGGQYLTVAEALQQGSYSKVYIMLGLNELGWVYESVFAEDYGKLIDAIQQSHPDATIYVQSIIPVSHWKETSDSKGGVYTNANVIRLQKALVELCEEKGVNYVNVAEVMQDTDGCLFSEATGDGVHLTAEYCEVWMDYLRTHTIQ